MTCIIIIIISRVVRNGCGVAVLCLVANWGIPIAAFTDAQANPDKISGKMTTGLSLHFLSFVSSFYRTRKFHYVFNFIFYYILICVK